MNVLTEAEERFLARQQRGRLATIDPHGIPQVKPVGFTYNRVLGTIDVAGYLMASSAKFRNVGVNQNVAFVVDEVTAPSMDGAHFLELRGLAETTTAPGDPGVDLPPEIIRIHPRRIIAFNVDPDRPGLDARNVAPARPVPEAKS